MKADKKTIMQIGIITLMLLTLLVNLVSRQRQKKKELVVSSVPGFMELLPGVDI